MKQKRKTVLGHFAPGARLTLLGVILVSGAASLPLLAVMALLSLVLK
ncbi:MAG: hypothetical protein ACQEVT_11675 [Pseudomonadota bacterium]|nr:hypothetical protein [Roseovarius sp. EGI FJ00037]MCZ0810995.1 hypothetical protein [Roseovarius sp. EGI FJ00037]